MYCPYCGVSNPEGAAICGFCGKDLTSPSVPVTCPSCGTVGREYQSNCAKCGAKLPRQQKTEPADEMAAEVAEPAAAVPVAYASTPDAEAAFEPTPDKSDMAGTKWCPFCGRPKAAYADMCEICKQSETESSEDGYSETSYDREMNLPMIGGFFIIIAGLLGLVYGLVTLADLASFDLPVAVSCFTSLMIVFGIIAIIGGISAMERKNAVYAILGGVFGLLSIGFYIGAIMSLVGLVLVIKSYNEFEVRELSLGLPR